MKARVFCYRFSNVITIGIFLIFPIILELMAKTYNPAWYRNKVKYEGRNIVCRKYGHEL